MWPSMIASLSIRRKQNAAEDRFERQRDSPAAVAGSHGAWRLLLQRR